VIFMSNKIGLPFLPGCRVTETVSPAFKESF
jgi:hypothetical protein